MYTEAHTHTHSGCVGGQCVLMTHTVIIFDQLLCARTQTDWLIWLRPPFDPTPVPGLTLLTSPQTTDFIFAKTVSSPHAVIGLLMRERRCAGHPSDGNYTLLGLLLIKDTSILTSFSLSGIVAVSNCSSIICAKPGREIKSH